MSRTSDLIDAYAADLKLSWNARLSGGERVRMLVYPPDLERSMRAALPKFELATQQSGHGWSVVDITDDFGAWVGTHRHADAFFAEPGELTRAIADKFKVELVANLREKLSAAPETEVVTLVGIGSLFPFLSAAGVIKSIDDEVTGRLLVLFPGTYDPDNHSFRLLDARDGFDYRARVIDPQKEIA
ncbi:DUF1788 domain-containing protein [Rhodococcus sp. BP-241]|uniref:BREX protein BrxB domain-containing protein n=1 Tax=Rhodococcus sp. BP-241 TaxID=2739441 RepID=UPI001C9AEA3E|nr:BREX protein BrxB domain-containing protein [Rhodococcus sp. BP-241]MBY6706228.1 DUF1788 domain-containing protein [Rhodococcus sp. BP-241]